MNRQKVWSRRVERWLPALVGGVIGWEFGQHWSAWTWLMLIICMPLTLVVHEGGHLLAVVLFRLKVGAVNVGSPPALVTVRVRTVPVSLGLRWRGEVTYLRRRTAVRNAVVAAAGPAANLIVAAVVGVAAPAAWPLVLTQVLVGLGQLLPGRAGTLSDGQQLLATPRYWRAERAFRRFVAEPGWKRQPDVAARLLAACRLQVAAARKLADMLAHRPDRPSRLAELLTIREQEPALPDRPLRSDVAYRHLLAWLILTYPQLTPDDAERVAADAEWVLAHVSAVGQDAAAHTLAVARLRQQRFAEAEQLSAGLLAATATDPEHCATVLATIALARHGLGTDAAEPLEQAQALAPDADLVGEAVRAAGAAAPATS